MIAILGPERLGPERLGPERLYSPAASKERPYPGSGTPVRNAGPERPINCPRVATAALRASTQQGRPADPRPLNISNRRNVPTKEIPQRRQFHGPRLFSRKCLLRPPLVRRPTQQSTSHQWRTVYCSVPIVSEKFGAGLRSSARDERRHLSERIPRIPTARPRNRSPP